MGNDFYFGYPFIGFPQYPEVVFGTTKRSYTIRIEELLKQKYPNLDPIDSDQMLQAGLDTVFKNMNLNVLSDKYKETFIIQFLNEFYMNEIGQETVDFFRQNLNRTIQNHGNYIKQLYEMAEQKYFIEYSSRIVDGEHEETTSSDGTRHNVNNTTTSNEHSDTGKEDHNISSNGTENANGTNTVNSTQDGTDSRTGNRNTTDTLSGQDSVTHATEDSTTYNVTDKKTVRDMRTKTEYGKKDTFEYDPIAGEYIEKSGSEIEDHDMKHIKYGTEETSGEEITGPSVDGSPTMQRTSEYYGDEVNTESFTNYQNDHNTTRSYNNYVVNHDSKNTAVQKFSDTPQDGLEGMGFNEGTGDYGDGGGNYGDGYDTYMSSAQINTQVGGNRETYNGSYSDSGTDTQNGSKESRKSFENNRHDVTEEFENRKVQSTNTTTYGGGSLEGRYDKDSGTIERTYNHYKESNKGGHSNSLSGTDTQTVNGEESNARTGTESTSHTGTDTTKYGRVDTFKEDNSENGTSKLVSNSDSTNRNERTTENSETGVRNTTNSGTATGSSSAEGTETTNSNGKANGTNRTVEEHFSYNRDAVFMTNDITDKIWELFSDCFMQVL